MKIRHWGPREQTGGRWVGCTCHTSQVMAVFPDHLRHRWTAGAARKGLTRQRTHMLTNTKKTIYGFLWTPVARNTSGPVCSGRCAICRNISGRGGEGSTSEAGEDPEGGFGQVGGPPKGATPPPPPPFGGVRPPAAAFAGRILENDRETPKTG